MLPGVELARKRRIHYSHEASPVVRGGRPEPPMWPRFERTGMDEAALVARGRLEEKLHRFPSTASSWSSRPSRNQTQLGSGNNALAGREARARMGENPVSAIDERPVRPALARKYSETDVCAVCLDELRVRHPVTNLPCSHQYHSDCVQPWLTAHSSCPSCRTLVVV